MRPSHHEALDRWLAAERDDRSDSADIADAALRELFEALPLLAPPAGFADRVLARTGLQTAATRSVFASRVLRLALVLSLIATALGAIWLPPTLRALAGLWSLGDVVELGIWAVAAGSRGLATVLSVWDWVFSLGRTVAGPLMTPQVTGALTLCLLVSGLAFRFLRDQISGERSWNHVHPI
ncbi:MAG: hypothetical protein QOF89_38 [Acidobacteriota bacterium]|jgi:hypothetical protein|nr:hypothetical protein [Acidobacteriota bacterium]